MYKGSIVIQNIKYGSWVGQNGFHNYMIKFGTLSQIDIVMKAMFWRNGSRGQLLHDEHPMAIFERIVGGTKHYRVFGIPPTWANVTHRKEPTLKRNV
jgi:hypothetical protein